MKVQSEEMSITDRSPNKSKSKSKSVSIDEESSGGLKLLQRSLLKYHQQQKQISLRRLQHVEKERTEVSLLHRNEYFSNYADFYDYWYQTARETKNIVYKGFSILLLIFLAILYLFIRLGYHLLKNIKTQIIYIIYDYTNLNISSYNRSFQKPDLRYDIRKKITLDDDVSNHSDEYSYWFTSKYCLYHLNIIAKRYHFVLVNIIMFLFTFFDVNNSFYISLDIVFGINVNQKLFTSIQIVIAIIIGYLNVSRSNKIRKDLTSFIRSITKRNEKIIDSNSTMLKTLDEIIADLRFYGFVHLRTEDENDIILSTTSYKTFNVSELRELIVDGVILLNGIQFRFLSVSENTLEGNEDISLHIYFYNYYNQWYSIIHNITINDLRIHDTLSVFLLFIYFFTSLTLYGYFYLLFVFLIFIFILLLFIRRQENRSYCFAWFDRHSLKWVRNRPNAKLEIEENAIINIYFTKVIQQNYFQLINQQLEHYRLKYINNEQQQYLNESKLIWKEDLIDIKPKDCLLFFAIKNGYNLSYRFDRMGFQLHDFIRFMNDVAYHYKFSLVLKMDYITNISDEPMKKVIYHLENPDAVKDTFIIEMTSDGFVHSVYFKENYVLDFVHKKIGWQLLWSELYVT